MKLEEESEDTGEDGETSNGEGGSTGSGSTGGGVTSGSGGRRVGGEGVSSLSLELKDCRSGEDGGIRDGLGRGEDDVTKNQKSGSTS